MALPETAITVGLISMDTEGFLRSLEHIPWFSALGKPNPRDDQVVRIREWEEWPGPEAEASCKFYGRRNDLMSHILVFEGEVRTELDVLMGCARRIVFEFAYKAIPFDPSEDSWHGPTAAVYYAANTAGVIGCYLFLEGEVPEELRDQWDWYVAGHWPCGYARTPVDGAKGILMVL